MATTYEPGIGPISEGTLNPEHLIPTFASKLRRMGDDLAGVLEDYPWMDDDDYDDVDPEELGYCLERLWELMEEYAPAYCYFGSTEGDGADIGYWPSIPEDWDEDVARVDAETPWHYCEETEQLAVFGKDARVTDASYVLSVTDHGNITLTDARTGHEVWSIV